MLVNNKNINVKENMYKPKTSYKIIQTINKYKPKFTSSILHHLAHQNDYTLI